MFHLTMNLTQLLDGYVRPVLRHFSNQVPVSDILPEYFISLTPVKCYTLSHIVSLKYLYLDLNLNLDIAYN